MADTHIAQGNAHYKSRNYEQAAESFTCALEELAKIHGDFSPESADVLLAYGKTLLELGIASNEVMRASGGAGAGPGDVDSDEGEGAEGQAANDNEGEEDVKSIASKASTLSTHVHLAEEQQPVASGSGSGSASANGRAADDAKPASGADDVDEAPEDDFNAAWEVLDAARTLFSKMEGDEARLSEAECFLTLGDVSLETENFAQATLDFTSSLALKSALLPPSSRELSEAHLKRAMALEFDPTPGARERTVGEVEQSKASLVLRVEELERQGGPAAQKEIDDIRELMEDLDLKIEDLRLAPAMTTGLPALLATTSATASTSATNAFKPITEAERQAGTVNELSGNVVRKKRKAPEPTAATGAEGEADGKKAKQ